MTGSDATSDWNYGSWEYFFDQLCLSYDISTYIHGNLDSTTTSNPPPLTPEDKKIDKIVLSWIFSTLSDALQKRVVVACPKSAKEAWSFISDIVKDHKRSRTSALKTELRSITPGDLSIEAYFWKIDSIMTILARLDSPVNDEDVVHYALAGLPSARSLLITEKMRLKTMDIALPADPSSPMALVADSGNSRRSFSMPHVKPWKPCFNYAKGAMGPMVVPGQATALPTAFTAGTLHDPATGAWNMDTCASSHLNSSVTSLSDIFNT
ncbi:ribonuclease H-like domain-containing protein [Tanacetum coccineum]